MKVEEYEIADVKLITPNIYEDHRGYFVESFNRIVNDQLKTSFIQDNESKSKKGTLRGLHFQNGNFAQAKLVRVVLGQVQDVIVDLRTNSPTFGEHLSIILDDKIKKSLFVPKGFAHGFLVLSEYAIFSYKVDREYNKNAESGILYKDPSLNIKWQINESDMIISNKDQKLMSFLDFKKSRSTRK